MSATPSTTRSRSSTTTTAPWWSNITSRKQPSTTSAPGAVSLQPPPPVWDPPAVPAPPPVQEGTGRVIDADGKPVPGALVFPGRWYRLRGDDAFDAFRPELVKDGVTTDAEGRFRLETKAPFVSA